MIWFPRIRTLATIDLNGHFGTGDCTETAARAFPFLLFQLPLGERGRTVSFLVHPFRRGDQVMGTDMDAEFAILAQF
jgi:hypothetical protein